MGKLRRDGIPKALKWAVFERDNYCCRYCGARGVPMEVDHVFPESKGGPTVLENLVTACEACNRAKRDRLGIYPLPVDYLDKMSEANEIIRWYNEYQEGLAKEHRADVVAQFNKEMGQKLDSIQGEYRRHARVLSVIRAFPYLTIGIILLAALLMFAEIAAGISAGTVDIGPGPILVAGLPLPLILAYKLLVRWYLNWQPTTRLFEAKE